MTIEEWIRHNYAFISAKAIEKQLGMPQATLYKFMKRERGIPKKWHDPLREFIQRFHLPAEENSTEIHSDSAD